MGWQKRIRWSKIWLLVTNFLRYSVLIIIQQRTECHTGTDCAQPGNRTSLYDPSSPQSIVWRMDYSHWIPMNIDYLIKRCTKSTHFLLPVAKQIVLELTWENLVKDRHLSLNMWYCTSLEISDKLTKLLLLLVVVIMNKK